MCMITKKMVLTESRVEGPPQSEPRHFKPYPGSFDYITEYRVDKSLQSIVGISSPELRHRRVLPLRGPLGTASARVIFLCARLAATYSEYSADQRPLTRLGDGDEKLASARHA